jgi:hypothetical protein
MRKQLAGIVAGFVTAFSLLAFSPDIIDTENGVKFSVISCAIRNTGSGWTVINDANHEPSNCISVTTFSDRLQLNHGVGITQVSSLTVTTDETYAKKAYRVGASAGLNYSNIYIYSGAANTAPMNPANIADANGNFWVIGLGRK